MILDFFVFALDVFSHQAYRVKRISCNLNQEKVMNMSSMTPEDESWFRDELDEHLNRQKKSFRNTEGRDMSDKESASAYATIRIRMERQFALHGIFPLW